jgi:hypothetical protein
MAHVMSLCLHLSALTSLFFSLTHYMAPQYHSQDLHVKEMQLDVPNSA